uniref:WD repeat domain 25 n=1 Tax=Bos indicus x Bos taurus TaxID=30522 RepID=A0A4W2EH33_BOBOX
MASLVAYEDSDSEAETEPAGSFHPVGQMEDTSAMLRPPEQDFGSRVLDATGGWAPSLVCGSHDDPTTCRLPLARLWSQDPGSCPSQRLRWPRPEPEATLPASPPARPSLWTSQAPAGHVPLAAARSKQVRVCWEPSGSPKPSLDARTGSEGPGKGSSSLQRKRREDCVVPYIPKRLRPLQALSTETDSGKDTEARGPLAGRVPAPLCVAPEVSEFIQPYLDSQYKETKIPKTVLFHLRGHRGPVNSVQWCPVSARSHMLLSTSMDKTFKDYLCYVGDTWQCLSCSGPCIEEPCPLETCSLPRPRSCLSPGLLCVTELTAVQTGDSCNGILCGIVHFSLAQQTTPTAGIQEPLVFMKGMKLPKWREAIKIRAFACLMEVNLQT